MLKDTWSAVSGADTRYTASLPATLVYDLICTLCTQAYE